ncbi:hypothetical protein BaOVIS_027590 [Babesia ovis]|uniref:Uncharacterized protein n=1 Tax=Babesia ovis TaxID=5869 RepID=A0A9W5TD62_BABOV|nr:hypothetical protein BaOVIS_027590 [Babesia ovis]
MFFSRTLLGPTAVLPAVARLPPRERYVLGHANSHGRHIWNDARVQQAKGFIGTTGPSLSSLSNPSSSGFKGTRYSYNLSAGNDGTTNNEMASTSNHGILKRFWQKVKGFFGGEQEKDGPVLAEKEKMPIQGIRPLAPLGINMTVSLHAPDTDGATEGSPYLQLVQSSPSAILTQFADQAPARVREAMKSTVGSLVGSLYRYCVETTMITTADRIASLVHSMQMTGYMLWNAECRYCLSQQLQADTNTAVATPAERTGAGLQLKDQMTPSNSKDALLSYVRNMPDETANALLDNITTDVMEAMQKSVDLVVDSLTGMAQAQKPPPMANQNGSSVPRVIVQQTGSSCVQLCFWQLALGYCLRQQEAKLELQNALKDS